MCNKQSKFIPFPGEPLYKVHGLCKIQRTKGENDGQETSKWSWCNLEQAHGTSLVSACITVILLYNVHFVVALHAKL